MAIVETKWVASLSDGSTAVERAEPFDEVSGGISSWQQLTEHISKNHLHICLLYTSPSPRDRS